MIEPLPQINALVTDVVLDRGLTAGRQEYSRVYQLAHDPQVARLVDAAVEAALEAAAPHLYAAALEAMAERLSGQGPDELTYVSAVVAEIREQAKNPFRRSL